MQTLYKINCSLKEYDEKVKNKTWEFPSYKDCCAICKRSECACGNGFYDRPVVEKEEVIPDLCIKRFLCTTTGTTFSLLPNQLVPYSKYRISLMTYILELWNKCKKNIDAVLEEIVAVTSTTGDICTQIYDELNIYRIIYFRQIFESAIIKYRIWKKLNYEYRLETFIRYCSNKYYCTSEILNNKYYYANGGYQTNSQFLFGKASQFRHSKK